jgi:3-hydroxybutyryl-CoA dehydrogenase
MLWTITVCGSGTMGQGIAQIAAKAGHSVRLFDAQEGRAKGAIENIRGSLAKLLEKGKVKEEEIRTIFSNLTVGTSLKETARGCDLFIEAVPENIDLKVQIFSEVLEVLAPRAILASNTSSLSITEIGARVKAADRTIGMHFFNPPPIMELVEIVKGLSTSEATIAQSLAFAKSLSKTAIVVRDVPGFATSRLGVILGAEAMRMVETNVASVEDIDRGMELGYRHPMGPLKLTDLVGLDVRLAILEHLQREIGDQFRPPAILRTLVRAGKLGKKTGEGFYVWKDGVATPRETF